MIKETGKQTAARLLREMINARIITGKALDVSYCINAIEMLQSNARDALYNLERK